jgi:hypothetical protein
VASYKDWIGVVTKASSTTGLCAGVVLISGLYMSITSHSFTAGWLAVSLALFVINGALAGGVLDKHLLLWALALPSRVFSSFVPRGGTNRRPRLPCRAVPQPRRVSAAPPPSRPAPSGERDG